MTIAGDGDDGRLRGHRPHRARQLQLPAGRHALGRLLRGALRDRPGHPRLGGRVRAGDGAWRRRGRWSTRARPRPWRAATSRPPAASSTRCSRRSGTRSTCPRRARGTMNNLTIGGAGLHVLRDPRRRPGRLAGRRRALRRPRGDEQHAEHAGRGPRDGLPPARGGVPAAPRLGRRRAPTAAATASSGGPRAGGRRRLGHRRAPRPRARGARGRRRRRPGAHHAQRRSRCRPSGAAPARPATCSASRPPAAGATGPAEASGLRSWAWPRCWRGRGRPAR